MATNSRKSRLKGHEKFIVREGWITKGLVAVKDNPRIFLDNEGTDLLGVGNNMVKSIRYWLKVFGLTKETQGKGAELTDLGEIIYKYDLYIEDIFTLWILHSEIVKKKEDATIWNLFFMNCEIEDFTKDEISILLEKEYKNYIEKDDYSKRSLSDDVDVILKMYGQQDDNKNSDPEDKNKSPFSELRLIKSKHGKFSKCQPNLNKLNTWVFIYELSLLLEKTNTISIDEIENKVMGKIYNLSRVNINQYLDRIEQLGYIKVIRTAGLDSVYKTEQLLKPLSALVKYYER